VTFEFNPPARPPANTLRRLPTPPETIVVTRPRPDTALGRARSIIHTYSDGGQAIPVGVIHRRPVLSNRQFRGPGARPDQRLGPPRPVLGHQLFRSTVSRLGTHQSRRVLGGGRVQTWQIDAQMTRPPPAGRRHRAGSTVTLGAMARLHQEVSTYGPGRGHPPTPTTSIGNYNDLKHRPVRLGIRRNECLRPSASTGGLQVGATIPSSQRLLGAPMAHGKQAASFSSPSPPAGGTPFLLLDLRPPGSSGGSSDFLRRVGHRRPRHAFGRQPCWTTGRIPRRRRTCWWTDITASPSPRFNADGFRPIPSFGTSAMSTTSFGTSIDGPARQRHRDRSHDRRHHAWRGFRGGADIGVARLQKKTKKQKQKKQTKKTKKTLEGRAPDLSFFDRRQSTTINLGSPGRYKIAYGATIESAGPSVCSPGARATDMAVVRPAGQRQRRLRFFGDAPRRPRDCQLPAAATTLPSIDV